MGTQTFDFSLNPQGFSLFKFQNYESPKGYWQPGQGWHVDRDGFWNGWCYGFACTFERKFENAFSTLERVKAYCGGNPSIVYAIRLWLINSNDVAIADIDELVHGGNSWEIPGPFHDVKWIRVVMSRCVDEGAELGYISKLQLVGEVQFPDSLEPDPESKALPLPKPGCVGGVGGGCNPASFEGFDSFELGNPISMYLGEKREKVVDYSIATPAGNLEFSRFFRQSKLRDSKWQFMGPGWRHNHDIFLTEPVVGSQLVLHGESGEEIPFYATDNNHYTAGTGSVSVLEVNSGSTSAKYQVIYTDKTVLIFDNQKRLRERRFPNGEYWLYNYDAGGKLIEVVDDAYDLGQGLKRKISFSYYTSGSNTGKLYRVSDHNGRFIELSYIAAVGATARLLATLRDVRGKLWTYGYYGQQTGENDPAKLDYLQSLHSPQVDTTGDGAADASIIIHKTDYSLVSGAVDSIVQQRGLLDTDPPLLVTRYNFHRTGQSNYTTITEEIVAPSILPQRITKRLFAGDVFAGTRDPAGNYSSRSLNGVYRPEMFRDAKGQNAELAWSTEGRHLTQVVDALGNEAAFDYNETGTVKHSIDAHGRKTKYTYDESNSNLRLPIQIEVFDTAEEVTRLRRQDFTYDANGRVLEELLVDPTESIHPAPAGSILKKTTRTYYGTGTGNGLLQTVTEHDLPSEVDTSWTTYTYDAFGRIIKTQRSSLFGSCEFSYTVYDEAGNVVATVCGPQNVTPPTTVAEAIAMYTGNNDNRVTSHEYDAIGRRFKTTINAGASFAQTTYTVYDALDRVVRTVANWDGTTNPVTTAHNAFPHGVDNTLNLVTETAYNGRGLVRKQTDVLGNVTLFGYDDADRLIKTVRNAFSEDYDNDYVTGDPSLEDYEPNGAPDQDIVTEQIHDPVGNVVKMVDALGNVSLMVYDALNRPIKTVRSASDSDYDILSDLDLSGYTFVDAPDQDLVESTEYDAMGRVVRTTDVMGSVTLYGYDALGRQVKVIRNASSPTYSLANDPDLSGYTPAADADRDVVTKTVYGADGRVISSEDAIGRRTWYAYDGLGRTVRTVANAVGTAMDGSTADPRSSGYILSGDSDEDLLTVTEYDSDGRVKWTEDKLGRKTWHIYDGQGREVKTIVNCAYVSGTPAPEDANYVGSGDPDDDRITQTVYDAQGRVLETIDAAGIATRFVYDILSRRIRSIRNYVVQGSSAPSAWVWEDGRWEDGANNAISHGANFDRNLISDTSYDLGGRVTATRDARGTVTGFDYDDLGRRRAVTQAVGAGSEAQHYTCYDKGGRVLRTIANYIPEPGVSPDEKDGNGEWVFAPSTHGADNDENLIGEYVHDRIGRTIVASDPMGNVVETTYFKDGQVEGMTTQNVAVGSGLADVETKYRYDGLRRREMVVENYNETTDPATWAWGGTSWETA